MIPLPHPSSAIKIAFRLAINRNRQKSLLKNDMDPVTKYIIKPKTTKNFQQKRPFKSIKSLRNIYLKSQVTTVRFVMQKVSSFRGNTQTVFEISTLNKTHLFLRDNGRQNRSKSISNNFRNYFKLEICHGYRSKLVNRCCILNLRQKGNNIRVKTWHDPTRSKKL
ncbi:hypothetical protein QL285_083222 [Trifolium repens]|nr:hypothetical protein QL285_083222 [Trifolium repens]